MVSEEELENWRKAGKIAAEVIEYSRGIVKNGSRLIDAADRIEAKIFELGAKPAFPLNISLNDVAAHDTAAPDDERVFDNHVVKIDVGVHVDGCIGDTALTIDLSGEHADLVNASKKALDSAIKIVKEDRTLGEIGAAIHEAITGYGFSPVKNLSGHGLAKFSVHNPPTIPNYDTGDKRKLEKGTFIAIEPFASAGRGEIFESGNALIFSQLKRGAVRNIITRQVLKEIEAYEKLPFTKRWLTKKFSIPKVNLALRELMKFGIIKEYPPLPDKAHGLISQAEHSLYIGEDKVEVLTKGD